MFRRVEFVAKVLWKFLKLVVGLFICSVGIVLTINCNLGLSPGMYFIKDFQII